MSVSEQLSAWNIKFREEITCIKEKEDAEERSHQLLVKIEPFCDAYQWSMEDCTPTQNWLEKITLFALFAPWEIDFALSVTSLWPLETCPLSHHEWRSNDFPSSNLIATGLWKTGVRRVLVINPFSTARLQARRRYGRKLPSNTCREISDKGDDLANDQRQRTNQPHAAEGNMNSAQYLQGICGTNSSNSSISRLVSNWSRIHLYARRSTVPQGSCLHELSVKPKYYFPSMARKQPRPKSHRKYLRFDRTQVIRHNY